MGEEVNETMDVWLANLITSGCCPGLIMVDEEQRVFHIPWCNEKSGGLRDGSSDTIFLQLWAEHKKYPITGGGQDARRKWKQNFRCALNKCHNITRLKDGKEFLTCQFKRQETGASGRKRKPAPTQVICEEKNYHGMEVLRPTLYAENNGRTVYPDSNSSNEFVQRSPKQVDAAQNSFSGIKMQNVPEMADCCVAIEVFYGSPHSLVRRWFLNSLNPCCRICSNECTVQALRETLQENKDIIELYLPPVEDVPNITDDSREMIRGILSKMDRGLTINFASGNIDVERRAVINIFVYAGTSQKLNRRQSRRDDPVIFNIFDFKEFHFSLQRHLENKCEPCPETNIFLTVGFEAFPNEVDPFLTVPMYMKITHMQAEKYKNIMLSRNDSVPYPILVSGFDLLGGEHEVAHSRMVGPQEPSLHSSQPVGNNGISNRDSVVEVQVFYGIPYFQVARRLLVADQPICTILYKSEGDECDGLKMELPTSTDLRHLNKINKILENLTSGVVIKYESRNILVERKSRVRVFLTDGILESTELHSSTRQERVITEAFNYAQFSDQLSEHIRDRMITCPKPDFILSLGSNIILNETNNPMRKVLMYAKVTHVKAARDLYEANRNNNQSSEPKISMPDSIDDIINFIKELSVEQKI